MSPERGWIRRISTSTYCLGGLLTGARSPFAVSLQPGTPRSSYPSTWSNRKGNCASLDRFGSRPTSSSNLLALLSRRRFAWWRVCRKWLLFSFVWTCRRKYFSFKLCFDFNLLIGRWKSLLDFSSATYHSCSYAASIVLEKWEGEYWLFAATCDSSY